MCGFLFLSFAVMEGPSGLAALLEVKQRETRGTLCRVARAHIHQPYSPAEVVDVACLFCRETIHGKRKVGGVCVCVCGQPQLRQPHR